MRAALVAAAALLVSASLSVGSERGAAAGFECRVTTPNGYSPPGARPESANHGSGPLLAVLWWTPDEIDARYVLPDGSIRLKVPWWRGVPGDLSIIGRRLDAAAPPLDASAGSVGYPETGYLPSGLLFATRGCWEITGTLAGASVTFVVNVAVGRERRGMPTATLRASRVRGGAVIVRWRATHALAFDVALRRGVGRWRVVRSRHDARSLTIRPRLAGSYAVRVRAHDSFGTGAWSPPKVFVVR